MPLKQIFCLLAVIIFICVVTRFVLKMYRPLKEELGILSSNTNRIYLRVAGLLFLYFFTIGIFTIFGLSIFTVPIFVVNISQMMTQGQPNIIGQLPAGAALDASIKALQLTIFGGAIVVIVARVLALKYGDFLVDTLIVYVLVACSAFIVLLIIEPQQLQGITVQLIKSYSGFLGFLAAASAITFITTEFFLLIGNK